MNDEELMKILIDLEKKGWAKRTDWGGWEITDKAKAFIEKYGKLPDRDEHDFYIPLPIIDGSPNRII